MPTFDTPGEYTYTVPSGVQTIRITANGAGGGGGAGGLNGGGDGTAGGPGGYAQGTLSVTPGETYAVYIGGGGGGGVNDSGGAGGTSPWFAGGDGGNGDVANPSISEGGGGGGGGGATVVLDNGTALTIAEAGGGGSGGSYDAGEGGGGGGGARGGLGGDGGDGTDDSGSPGDDAAGTGAGGDGANVTDSGADGDPGGASVGGAVTNTTTTTGGGNAAGVGGAGGTSTREDGTDGQSGSVLIEESPPAPSLTAGTIDATSITVDIGDTDNEDSAELEYKLASDATFTTQTTYTTGELPATETITGLLNGRDYDIRITATNSIGSSSTTITEQTVLPAPTNLTATDVRDSEVDLTWAANHTNGETRVEVREDDSGTWTTKQTVSNTTESVTVDSLLNGQLYGVRVVSETQDAETIDQ